MFFKVSVVSYYLIVGKVSCHLSFAQPIITHATRGRVVIEQTARGVLPFDIPHNIVDVGVLVTAGDCIGRYLPGHEIT